MHRAELGAEPKARLGALVGVTVVGVAAGVATGLGAGLGEVDDTWRSIVRGASVASYVGVGAYTAWRRPDSRLGLFVAVAGVLYAVASLAASVDSVEHTVGRAALAAFAGFLAYIFLCFPYDHLRRSLRRPVALAAGALTVLWLAALPLVQRLPSGGPLSDCGRRCPDNAFVIVSSSDQLTRGITAGITLVTAASLLGVAAVLGGRARSAVRLQRRMVVPLLCAVIALAVNYALFTSLRQAGVESLAASEVLGAAAALAIPAAMLLGQVRGRLFAARSAGQLVARIGDGPVTQARVEALLRDALGDPLLQLAVHDPTRGRFVASDGEPVELPGDTYDLAVKVFERGGFPAAAVVYDAALTDASGVADGLMETALMLLENAELVEDLRGSRGRIVTAAQEERIRVERDLHDTAQARLFALQLALVDVRARERDPELAQELVGLADDVAAAAAELRRVAHGIYPPLLRERGLSDALRAVARDAPFPVRVEDGGVGRLTPTVEEAVYFAVREALQNTVKHAGPDARASVTLDRQGGALEFTVSDSGAGFDAPGREEGHGLLGMRDRIGAVGGRLDVVSQQGRGTTVRGIIPDCWPAPS